MAGSLRYLRNLNGVLCNSILLRNTVITGNRYIYSENSLGMSGYETARTHFRNQFMNVENIFRKKMLTVCDDASSMVFTEDLKAMLHLIQKDPEDIELIIKMMKKFHSQNKELRFGTYIFGPVVMRTFHFLDEPDIALSVFNDPALTHFFDQMSTYQILLCLLYKHGKYAEIRSVYDSIKSRYVDGTMYPRNATLLVLAACYKENTPETLEYATKLWKELTEKGFVFLRRNLAFIALLAINQNAPHIALEIVSADKEAGLISIKGIKLLAYVHLNKFTETIPLLREALEFDNLNTTKQYFFVDVIEQLQNAVSNANDQEKAEVLKLISQIRAHNLVSSMSLHAYICKEIEVKKPTHKVHVNEFQSETRNERFGRPRAGLRDLL